MRGRMLTAIFLCVNIKNARCQVSAVRKFLMVPVKRETGGSPVRSRRCKKGAHYNPNPEKTTVQKAGCMGRGNAC